MLVQLYEDEKYRKELARKGREIALQFDHQKVLPKWITVMKQIEENKKHRNLLKWCGYEPAELTVQ